MDDWKEFNFSDIVLINPKVNFESGQEFPFVEMKNIDGINRWCESYEKRKITGGSKFKNGDILFARITPCLENGKIAQIRNLINGKGFGSTEFLVFRGIDNISDTNFIYYLSKWQNVRDYAEQHMEGTSGRQRVNQECFSNLKLLIPSYSEQRAISSVLSSLDNKIDILHRQNVTLESMAETLFRQWFIVEAKDDWIEIKLEDLFDVYIGRTPSRSVKKYFSFCNGNTWISIKDMDYNGVYIFDSFEYLTEYALDNYSIPIIPKNTVVLSFKMTVGRVKITSKEMYSNEAIACFINKNKHNISNEYLYIFLKLFKYDELGSTSTIVTSINTSIIKSLIIKIPDEKRIKKFNKITHDLFNKIKSNQFQIRTLEHFRDTLLPKLMSGEIRVKCNNI